MVAGQMNDNSDITSESNLMTMIVKEYEVLWKIGSKKALTEIYWRRFTDGDLLTEILNIPLLNPSINILESKAIAIIIIEWSRI